MLTETDLHLLRTAIELARQARAHGNHPFGALLADREGNILLQAENTVTTGSDCTGHAETNLMRLASHQYSPEQLAGCMLYTSTEPCAMCAGAIFWGGVGRVVYALSEAELYSLAGESADMLKLPCREVFARGGRPTEVLGPALEEEAREVHAGFWTDVEGRAFPLPSSDLYGLLTDAEFKQRFHARLEKGNSFIVLMYKLRILPLFGLGKQIMLLTTRGRKSGKLRDTPIGYFRIDGIIHVFSGWGKEANWYKNIAARPDEAFLLVGFKRSPARAEFLSDPTEIQQTFEKLVVQNPKGAGYLMGWDAGVDRPETADFSLMIERVLVVKFYPK